MNQLDNPTLSISNIWSFVLRFFNRDRNVVEPDNNHSLSELWTTANILGVIAFVSALLSGLDGINNFLLPIFGENIVGISRIVLLMFVISTLFIITVRVTNRSAKIFDPDDYPHFQFVYSKTHRNIAKLGIVVLVFVLFASIASINPRIPSLQETQNKLAALIDTQPYFDNKSEESMSEGPIPFITIKHFEAEGITDKIQVTDSQIIEDDSGTKYSLNIVLGFRGNWTLTHRLIGNNANVECRIGSGTVTFKIVVDWIQSSISVSDYETSEAYSIKDCEGQPNPIDPEHDSIGMQTNAIQRDILSTENLQQIFPEDAE